MKLNYLLGLSDPIMEDKELFRCWVKDPYGKSGVSAGTPGFLLKGPTIEDEDADDRPVKMANPFDDAPLSYQMTKKSNTKSNYIVLPFSGNPNSAPRRVFRTDENRLSVVSATSSTNILKDVSVVETDVVLPEKLKTAAEFVNKKGPLVLINRQGKGLYKAIKSTIQEAISNYKFVGYTYRNHRSSSKPLAEEQIIFILTIFKPSWCIPYFGEDHGAFVSANVVYPDRTERDEKLVSSLEFSFLFTDNISAISKIDGSNTAASMGSAKSLLSWLGDVNTVFNKVGESGNKFKIKKKKSKNGEAGSAFSI